jgi:hypothetical protein
MGSLLIWLVETSLYLLWAFLFVLLAIAGEIGYRCGRFQAGRRAASDTERSAIATLVAAMVTLLAFGLGLTISFAQSRFETRRDLVAQEANAIGTAWLRAGLFDAPEGPALRRLIEDYATVRLKYIVPDDRRDVPEILKRTSDMQNEIWAEVQSVARKRTDPVAASMIAAANEMIDLSLSQHFAFANRVPVYLLWAILFGSVLSVGAMQYQFGVVGTRQPALTGLLLFMWTGAMIVIVDLNRPRLGELRVDPAPLIWTIQGFAPGSPAR